MFRGRPVRPLSPSCRLTHSTVCLMKNSSSGFPEHLPRLSASVTVMVQWQRERRATAETRLHAPVTGVKGMV